MLTQSRKNSNTLFQNNFYNGIISFRKSKFKVPGIKFTNTERAFMRWLANICLKRVKNEKIGKIMDNAVWAYKTLEGLAEELDVCSRTISNVTNSLLSKGIIKKGKLSSKFTDHTVWYTFDLDFLKSFLEKNPDSTFSNGYPTKESTKTTSMKKIQTQLELPNGNYKSTKSTDLKDNFKKEEAVVLNDSTKTTTAQDMIKIWNDELGRNDRLNLTIAKHLVAAYKLKFNCSIEMFARYIKKIQNSPVLNSDKFVLRLGWVLKFQTIDDIANGAYGTGSGDIAADFLAGKISNVGNIFTKQQEAEIKELIEYERSTIVRACMEPDVAHPKPKSNEIDLGEAYNKWINTNKHRIRRSNF